MAPEDVTPSGTDKMVLVTAPVPEIEYSSKNRVESFDPMRPKPEVSAVGSPLKRVFGVGSRANGSW